VSVTWFQPGKLVYFHDEVIPVLPKIALADYMHVWKQSADFGAESSGGIPKLVPFAVFWVLSLVGFSVRSTEIFLYVFALGMAGTGAYLLFRLIAARIDASDATTRFAGTLAAVLYMTAPFTYMYLWRTNYIITRAWFFALIPWVALLTIVFFAYPWSARKKKSLSLLALGLSFAFISPSFSHPAFFMMAFLVVVLCIGLSLAGLRKSTASAVVDSIAILVLFVAANLYWLLPRFATAQAELENAATVGLLDTFNQNSSALTVFRNLALTDTPAVHEIVKWLAWSDYLLSPVFVLAAIFLFGVALLSLRKQSPLVLTLWCFFLAIYALMLGTAGPFSFFKQSLFQSVSVLQAFRDPAKWGFLLCLLLPILYGLGVIQLMGLRPRVLRNVGLLGVAAAIGFMTWPYYAGQLIPRRLVYPAAQIAIPDDYYQVAQYLRANNQKRPIIQFPLHSTHNYASWEGDNGYKGVDLLRTMSAQPLLDTNSGPRPNELLRLTDAAITRGALTNEQLATLMSNLNSRYIVVNLDSNSDFIHATLTPAQYAERLDSLQGLKRIMRTEHIALYEELASGWKPSVYAPGKLITKSGTMEGVQTKLNLATWSLAANPRAQATMQNGQLELHMTPEGKGDFAYVKSPKLNIDPNLTPYLMVNLGGQNSAAVSLAVSADDGSGDSLWLQDITAQVNKTKTGADPNVRVFSLESFADVVTTLRVNIISKDNAEKTTSIDSITTTPSVYGDYSAYSSSDIRSSAYSDNQSMAVNGITIAALAQHATSADVSIRGKGHGLLVMQHAYNPNWKLSVKGKSVESRPVVVNGFQQGWLVDMEQICADTGLCSPTDNGMQVQLTAYYAPQRTFLAGTSATVGVLGLLGAACAIMGFGPYRSSSHKATGGPPEAIVLQREEKLKRRVANG
jgi:hypothetical protein